MKKINLDKAKLLNELLDLYKNEIYAIYAVGATWKQLKEAAKNVCADDFDKALIARETALEELLELQENDFKIDYYQNYILSIDNELLRNDKIVKEIYGLDVKAFLNIENPKSLPSKK